MISSLARGRLPPLSERLRRRPRLQASPRPFQSEVELVLACGRSRVGPERAARIRQLAALPLDWGFVLRQAERHKLSPLLYFHLSAICPELIPGPALDGLRGRFQANAQRSLLLTRELLRVVDLLESNGIPVIPYKGPVLSSLAYGNLALREFLDLDVLIHRRDVLRAKDLLAALRYRPIVNLSSRQERLLLNLDCEYVFVQSGTGCQLELHWRFLPSWYDLPLDDERPWSRHQTARLAGRDLRVLSPEDLLLVLCLHAGPKHAWQQLSLIVDIAELIRTQPGLDWTVAREQARRLGCERVLRVSLLLAGELLEAEVPLDVLDWAGRDLMARSLALEVVQGLFRDGNLDPADRVWGLVRFNTKERLVDRVRFAYRLLSVPTPADWEVFQLPPLLYCLYLPLRLLRLAGKRGRRLLHTRGVGP